MCGGKWGPPRYPQGVPWLPEQTAVLSVSFQKFPPNLPACLSSSPPPLGVSWGLCLPSTKPLKPHRAFPRRPFSPRKPRSSPAPAPPPLQVLHSQEAPLLHQSTWPISQRRKAGLLEELDLARVMHAKGGAQFCDSVHRDAQSKTELQTLGGGHTPWRLLYLVAVSLSRRPEQRRGRGWP